MSGRRWRSSGSDLSSDDFSIEEVVMVNEFTPAGAAAPAPDAPAASGHNGHGQGPPGSASRQELIARRGAHRKELERLDDEMRRIQELRRGEKESIHELTLQLGGPDKRVARGSGGSGATKNYFDKFEWSEALKEQMESVFGIKSFRLAQEGVCNANMDKRDIICIMPTGGGKSLTYQLPATLMSGCTLVVSPLVALIKDQDMHLQERHIEGLTFTAKMPQAKITEGYNRLRATIEGTSDPTGKEVKLCYVTPERLAKSDEFRSIVAAMVAADKLARIVIDEAHCISQLGRDYRPHYKQLADLRVLCPRVPIMALSATCPPDVLRDLIAILGLQAPTNGTAAKPLGTVLFTSPLYRKNLHYKVLPKPSGRMAVVRNMVEYILDRHPNETGIVYCLSRADAERVAELLFDESQGRIKTGIYHAEIDDKAKEDLHESWLLGKVKVVCATTAFGLGINKANVRFVLHHSMPKSLETFYQESGRAGRDGRDADCILYYRLVDALRTSGMKADTDWQQQEAHSVIKFCLDLKECRKLKFAMHFSSSDFSWAEDNTPCGHCDNCIRDPASVVQRDLTSEAKRVLAVARVLTSRNTNFTAVQLARTARGNDKLAKSLNLARGEKVTLSLLDTEVLVAHLILEGYLEKFTVENAYTVHVYVRPAPSRHLDDGQKLVVQLRLSERTAHSDHSPGKRSSGKRKAAHSPSKRKGRAAHNPDNDNNDNNSNNDDDDDDDEEDRDFGDCSGEDGEGDGPARPSESAIGSPAKRRRSNHGSSCAPAAAAGRGAGGAASVVAISGSDSEDAEWTGNMPSVPPAKHRLRRSGRRRAAVQRQGQGQGASGRGPSGAGARLDDEVIEISSN